jgi:hypothetical protein
MTELVMAKESDDLNDDGRHDPQMTLFIIAIVLLLLGCVALILIANSRPPAGL